MSSEEIKKLNKEMENMCISLKKFLILYCGIFNEEIHNIKLSHQDIKELMPYIKRVSFEKILKNKTWLYSGDVIAVKDSYGNLAPYMNPMLEVSFPIEFDCEIAKEDKDIEDLLLDDNLNFYELRKLCKYYKEHNKLKEYRIAYRLLKEQKGSNKVLYKKKRDNLIMEGRLENDEY